MTATPVDLMPRDELEQKMSDWANSLAKEQRVEPNAAQSLQQFVLKQSHRHQPRGLDRRIKKLIDWERSKVGIHERGFSNTGPQIDRWEKDCGFHGAPYCALFQIYALKHVAGIHIPCDCAYTPNILNHARAHSHGFKGLFSISHRMRGDLQLMKFGPGDPVQHVGLYIGRGYTIEANTSSGNSGSQANGGGVYIRRRSSNVIVGYARVF